MQCTEFKIDLEQAADRMAIVLRNIAKSTGNEGNALSVAVASVMKRFAMHGKARYTDYGPYWFALKDVLNRNGQSLGDVTDSEIAAEYRGKSDLETIIMADMFREMNLALNPIGTVKYQLDGYSGEDWVLRDQDMEIPSTQ
jgi:hypothetical protein